MKDGPRAEPRGHGGNRGRIHRLCAMLLSALEPAGRDRTLVWIAIILLAASLDTGLAADDYLHMEMASGAREIPGFDRHPLDLFRFTSEEHTPLLMRDGILSFWDDPEAKLAFLRPVSSLTHYVDHLVFGASGFFLHLHSLAWSALLLFSVCALYRKLLGPGLLATTATFLYVLDDARAWLVSWVAARNAVVATSISVLALLLYLHAREQKKLSYNLLSASVLLVALLAGEGALAICGYMIAHALTLDPAPPKQRVLALLPHGLVFVAWRGLYRALDYGAHRSGLYFDPIDDPIGYLGALAERGPVLLFAQLGGSWSDAWQALFTFPRLQLLIVLAGAVVVGLVGYLVWPLARRDAQVRFGMIGALLSLLTAVPAFSADRLLTWIALGASVVLAKLLVSFRDAPEALHTSKLRALVLSPIVLWLLIDHVLIEPVFLPSRARGNVAMRDILDRAQAGVPSDPEIANKRVIYVNPAAVPLAAYLPVERAVQNIPRPAFQTWLATADTEVRVRRIDERTLHVHPRGGYMLSPPSRLFAGRFRTFRVGETIDVGPVRYEITALMPDGRAAQVRASFDRPLEDPSFVWRHWDDLTFRPFVPPAVGESVVLPAADYLRVVFGDALPLPFDGRMPAPPDPYWSGQ